MLPQVVTDVEWQCCRRFDKYILKVDFLRTSWYFLKLLTRQLRLAIANFSLGLRLFFEFFLYDSIVSVALLCTNPVKILRCRLVLTDRLLHIQGVDFVVKLKLQVKVWHVHPKVWITLNFFFSFWRRSLRLFDFLINSFIFFSVNALML
jgi:hypothetical protein